MRTYSCRILQFQNSHILHKNFNILKTAHVQTHIMFLT